MLQPFAARLRAMEAPMPEGDRRMSINGYNLRSRMGRAQEECVAILLEAPVTMANLPSCTRGKLLAETITYEAQFE